MLEKLVGVLKKHQEKSMERAKSSEDSGLRDFNLEMATHYGSCINHLLGSGNYAEVKRRLEEKRDSLPKSFERNAYMNALVIYENPDFY